VPTAQQVISNLNQAWQANDLAKVSACFHPDAVLLPPDLGPAIQGQAAITEAYATFNNSAKLLSFSETQWQTFTFESSHAVHLHFSLAYELDGQRLQDDGLDIYLLELCAQELVVVWRQQIVSASQALPDDTAS